jgi:hypothetical protein
MISWIITALPVTVMMVTVMSAVCVGAQTRVLDVMTRTSTLSQTALVIAMTTMDFTLKTGGILVVSESMGRIALATVVALLSGV